MQYLFLALILVLSLHCRVNIFVYKKDNDPIKPVVKLKLFTTRRESVCTIMSFIFSFLFMQSFINFICQVIACNFNSTLNITQIDFVAEIKF